jgi:hypothetical protein
MVAHARNVYLREDAFAARITRWLTGLFAPGGWSRPSTR